MFLTRYLDNKVIFEVIDDVCPESLVSISLSELCQECEVKKGGILITLRVPYQT